MFATTTVLLSVAILARADQRPNATNSLSFTLSAVTCNPDLIKGSCLYNHPIDVGYIDARNYLLHSDLTAVKAKTSCPVKDKSKCPTNDGSTQFNTTFGGPDSSTASGPGHVYMNSHTLQKLYVQHDGLISYSHPETPNQFPKGAYANLWYLEPYTIGSCLDCSFALSFNNTQLLYTCKNPAPGSKGNLTYAATPAADVSKCMSFAALGSDFCTTQIPGDTCGNNAWKYS